jgi:hypothetical protein
MVDNQIGDLSSSIDRATSCISLLWYAVDGRDRQHLERLRIEHKEKIGSFRESHHNLLRKLLEVNYFF